MDGSGYDIQVEPFIMRNVWYPLWSRGGLSLDGVDTLLGGPRYF